MLQSKIQCLNEEDNLVKNKNFGNRILTNKIVHWANTKGESSSIWATKEDNVLYSKSSCGWVLQWHIEFD